MTEQEWLTCAEPEPMLKSLGGRASERQLRLFACACCRRVLWLLGEGHRQAVGLVEEYVGTWKRGGLHAARRVAREAGAHLDDERYRARGRVAYCRAQARNWAHSAVWEAARQNPATAAQTHQAAAVAVGWWHKAEEEARGLVTDQLLRVGAAPEELRAQAALLRDVARAPSRRPALHRPRRAFKGGRIAELSAAACDTLKPPEGTLDPTRLAILADALEEAGCTDPNLLGHLRGNGPHVRGCWVIDLLLGKG